MKLPDTIQMDEGRGGLRCLRVSTVHAEAEIYLHGAHLTQFQRRGQKPVLFLSGQSWFESGKPIRGGVPICFPWFGARQDGRAGPGHGFARLREWELAAADQAGDGSVEIRLRLVSTEATRREWDGDFEMEFRVRIGPELGLELRVRNAAGKPMRFEEALHTYLAVSDVRQVSIDGLANTAYLDTVGSPPRREIEGADPIRITAETDRIYLYTRSACVVHDPGWQRRLTVRKTGSDATVLWNPWIAKAKRMPDFGDDEWPAMLCIETGNVGEHAVALAPGESHSLGAVISSLPTA